MTEADTRFFIVRLSLPIFFLTLLSLFFPAPSEGAGKFTAFEKEYLREEGEPVAIGTDFTVTDPRASYILKIYNNGLKDTPKERVSTSEILLNDVPMIRSSDFNQRVALFERPISLKEKNTLQVKLKGSSGGRVTLRIIGTDPVPPQLTVTAPTSHLLTRHPSPSFTLQYSDGSAGIDRKSFRATLNGNDLTPLFQVGEGEATYTPDPLPDNTYTLEASIADQAENRTETKVTFQVDATSPETDLLPSDAPGESGWRPASRLEASDPGSGVAELHYQIDSNPEVVIRPDPNLLFSERRTLSTPLSQEGKFNLFYYAVDRAGNQEPVQQRSLQIDRTPPQIKAHLFPPPNEFGWHQTDVIVRFEGTDTLSGLASVTPPMKITTEGQNQIAQGVAVDHAGNERRLEASIWIDKTPPTLSLETVPEGAVLAAKAVPLTFSFNDSLSQVRPDRLTVVMNRVDLSAVFRSQEGLATKTFALADRKYILTASIEDRAENKTELTRLFTVDTIPPDLTVADVEGGRPIKADAVRLAGKATDATTSVRSLRVNGVEIPLLAGGEFAVPFPLLNEGMNLLKIDAIDEAGNAATKEVRLVRDTAGPEFSEMTPAPGSFTRLSTVTISGRVRDLATSVVSLRINGTTLPLSPEKGDRFSVEIPLPKEGENPIEITAIDEVGHQTTHPLFSVVRDTAAPVIDVAQPLPGSSVPTSPAVVAGQISDAGPITTFSLNGRPVTLQENRFSIETPLQTGENTLRFSATDAAGNQTEVIRTILLDPTLPDLKITSPKPGQRIASKTADLIGRVIDPTSSISWVMINGIRIVPTATGDFATVFPLNIEGENRFDFIATDRAGNHVSASVTVIRDTVPPDLQLVQPAEGLYTDEPTLALTGTTSDREAAEVSVMVDGISVPLKEGRFKTIVSLKEGENALQLTATDAAGNVKTLSRSVILDTRPPKITLDAPPADGPISTSTIILSGTVTDPSPLRSVTLNGNRVPVTQGAFKFPVVLSPGRNTLVLSATDAAGNIATVRWEATLPEP
jgi:hypothetical protein